MPSTEQIFIHHASILANVYKCAKFQLPSFISFRDNQVSQNLMWGLLAPCSTPYAETFT